MAYIEIQHLSHAFAEHQVLSDINFTIEQGASIALLGASGVGKSILFHILAGVMQPSKGTLIYEDKSVDCLPVSYMQQNDLLIPWYTVEHNVILPALLQGVKRQDALLRAREYLPLFGLSGFGRHYPHQLSGGMRQRVALLRAIMHEQPIVLMDEPFSALDALTSYELRMFVKKIQQEQQFTMLFVTHNVDEALDLADEIWVMHKTTTPQIKKMNALQGDYLSKRTQLWQELGLCM
ncbi:ATP-binding cassette domain-containing protein [Entomospira nematocerorum]|uniref:ATP-binding cassette domain-containing protein n=1 Tax=Entomospira nematocerorum TaxID=2719987 RepID=A0A968KUD2_9SPIO|nr:ATP-binding cassette domain-containing protein [Entomospira nematocera]NIZ47149.1 ATP-binding cassette domain-containing protein [Entomospira nematocera]WDI34308.1 ATP-binding cassette domain-containing protein [Entomospira nematocera]